MRNDELDIIEGVGNEVLLSIPFVIASLVVIWHLSKRAQQVFFIHRENQSAVDATRQHLNYTSNRLLNNADDNNMATPHFGSDQQCPICLNEPRYPIETNCGHLFCAQCLILYWRHGNWIGAVRCPVCRQTVTVILRCFRDQSISNDTEREELTQILFDVNDYNRRFSGEPRPWQDYLWDLPTLLRHVGSEFFSVGGLMYMFRLRIVLCFVAAIMYLISPLDMIPEAVFGILGLLDDMFVVLLLAVYVTVIYRRFLASRWREAR